MNKESGGGDSDLELYEFLQFLVTLAFSMDKDTSDYVTSLQALLSKLSRSRRIEELAPLLGEAASEPGVAASLEAGGASTAFQQVSSGGAPVSERSFLQQLEKAKLIRSVIVTLPGGAEGHADLSWQDASAAFQVCGGGKPLSEAEYANCLALCAMSKYAAIETLSPAKRVEGFLANLAGTQDEHAVIGAGKF